VADLKCSSAGMWMLYSLLCVLRMECIVYTERRAGAFLEMRAMEFTV
jgi:hypothetical protein